MHIRPAHMSDASAIWSIIGPTIRAGETYALDRDMRDADALAYWMGNDRETFVVEENGEILGTYYLQANQVGGGKHICNCGYMTGTAATGRGVARAMCQHSLEHARQRGYRGMQLLTASIPSSDAGLCRCAGDVSFSLSCSSEPTMTTSQRTFITA